MGNVPQQRAPPPQCRHKPCATTCQQPGLYMLAARMAFAAKLCARRRARLGDDGAVLHQLHQAARPARQPLARVQLAERHLLRGGRGAGGRGAGGGGRVTPTVLKRRQQQPRSAARIEGSDRRPCAPAAANFRAEAPRARAHRREGRLVRVQQVVHGVGAQRRLREGALKRRRAHDQVPCARAGGGWRARARARVPHAPPRRARAQRVAAPRAARAAGGRRGGPAAARPRARPCG